VLHHDLPRELWPVMDEVLAAGVQLRMLDADQLKVPETARIWQPVPAAFVNGGRAVFNRKYLERAAALQMVIRPAGHEPKIFEFTVDHERPVKPAKWLGVARSI